MDDLRPFTSRIDHFIDVESPAVERLRSFRTIEGATERHSYSTPHTVRLRLRTFKVGDDLLERAEEILKRGDFDE